LIAALAWAKTETGTPGLRRISTGSVCLALTLEMTFTAPDWSAPLTRSDRPFRVSVSVGRPELAALLTDALPTATIDAAAPRMATALPPALIAILPDAT
jgi:hypothetical protein